jgi:hypothetical protein
MNWIEEALLTTAFIAVCCLWYLLHQIFRDSPRKPYDQDG